MQLGESSANCGEGLDSIAIKAKYEKSMRGSISSTSHTITMKASLFFLSIIAAVAAAKITPAVDSKPNTTLVKKPTPTIVGRGEAKTTDVEE
ncbi:hypothetical protein Daus18300_007586 [Diaporthe australafricana]|uniref:Uncharacterized protein n=1 Tax=Diaporthe australafricana TaxID=127596 RepID=A0ABR3WLP6_9PEZI